MMKDDVKQSQFVILYPAGGAFNKLRANQSFLENLLVDNLQGYADAKRKREYVKSKILDVIPEGLRIFKGSKPLTGCLTIPEEDEQFERIAQRMRDIKKMRTKKEGKRSYTKRKPTRRKRTTSTVSSSQSTTGVPSAAPTVATSTATMDDDGGTSSEDCAALTPWIPEEIVMHVEGTDPSNVKLILSLKNQVEWFKFNCEKLVETIAMQRDLISSLEKNLGSIPV